MHKKVYKLVWSENIETYSLVMIPLGPVGVASFGSIPWVSRMCLAAGLSRNLNDQEVVSYYWQQLGC